MGDKIRRIKIFVASPGDLAEERNLLPNVIQEINLNITAIAPEKKVLLDFIRWETHISPVIGPRIQDHINNQLPDYDIFIGIMWKRFGTPTGSFGSGTEEEFNRAYSKWKKDNKFPILFYFCQYSSTLPRSIDEVDELKKVLHFKENLTNKGLICEYNSHNEFADIVRRHLVLTLSKILSSTANQGRRKTGRIGHDRQ
jgi:hypothetical protein